MFHFTDKEGLSGILKSKSLWLTNTKDLNDFSERIYASILFTTLLFKTNNEDVNYLRNNLSIEDILQENFSVLECDTYSASFCQNFNNDYLWDNYADNKKGVAIEVNEQYLNEYFKSKFINQTISFRPVFYGVNKEQFLKIMNLVSSITIGLDSKKIAANRLYFALYIASGIFKDDKYKDEEETKLYFKNEYSDNYVQNKPIHKLTKFENDENLNFLGLAEEKNNGQKRYLDLNLLEVFNSKLIPSIILGEKYDGNIKELRDLLTSLDLKDTKIRNSKGETLYE